MPAWQNPALKMSTIASRYVFFILLANIDVRLVHPFRMYTVWNESILVSLSLPCLD